MKKIFVLFLLFFLLPELVSAMEITSPFGWRTHPITGVQRFHSGVDIAGDYGDAIPVGMGGIASTGFDPGGYGNFVQIDHPDGTQTLYGHCQALFVHDGDSVTAGQVIAAVGSTGGSTGPHVHVEYLVNGRPTDPMPILLAAGWDLTYNGGDGMEHPDADEMPWDFGNFYELAKQLRILLNAFSKQCTEGLTLLQTEGMTLLTILMTIDLALAFVLSLLKEEDDWSTLLIRKFLHYSFIVWLVGNWKDFVNSFILDHFSQVAITAGGGGAYIADNLSDPSKIIQNGVSIVQPIFDYISTYSGAHLMANIHHVFIAMLLGIGILTCFILIGTQFFLTYLQFYIISTVSVILVPFGLIKQVKFIGEKGISAVVNVGIKLMVMTFLVSFAVYAAENFKPDNYESIYYLRVLLNSMALLFLVSSVSNIMKLLNGSVKM